MIDNNIGKNILKFLIRVSDYYYLIDKFKILLLNNKQYNIYNYLDELLKGNCNISADLIVNLIKNTLRIYVSKEDVLYFFNFINGFKEGNLNVNIFKEFMLRNQKNNKELFMDYIKSIKHNNNISFNYYNLEINKCKYIIEFSISKIIYLYILFLKEKCSFLEYLEEYYFKSGKTLLDIYQYFNIFGKDNMDTNDIINFFHQNNYKVSNDIAVNILKIISNYKNKLNLNDFCIFFTYDPYIDNEEITKLIFQNYLKKDDIINTINFDNDIILLHNNLKKYKILENYTVNNEAFYKQYKDNNIKSNVSIDTNNYRIDKYNKIQCFFIIIKKIINYEKKLIDLKTDLLFNPNFSIRTLFYMINENKRDNLMLNDISIFFKNYLNININRKELILFIKNISNNGINITYNDLKKYFNFNGFIDIKFKPKNDLSSYTNKLDKSIYVKLQNLFVKSIEYESVVKKIGSKFMINESFINNFLFKKESITIDNFKQIYKKHGFELKDKDLLIFFNKISKGKKNINKAMILKYI